MTASEMFEKLGYKRNVENKKIIYFLELEGTFYYDEITFDLLEKEILIDTNFEVTSIGDYLLKAIDKQVEELGWLDEKTCTNESEYDSIEQFECSNCGFISVDHTELKINEDNGEELYQVYKPKYCPNCGRKIVD